MKRNSKSFVTTVDEAEKSSKYLISGVYAFGGGNLFITMLHIFALVHCKEELSHYFFSIGRFIFTLIQMIFIQKFSAASFRRSIKIILILFHLLGTNICIWIRFLIEETNLLPKTHQDRAHEHCLNVSNISSILSNLDAVATPFTMEF